MGNYTVYCNGSRGFTGIGNGKGTLTTVDQGAHGDITFDKSSVPTGEVFETAVTSAIYCSLFNVSLIFGKIAGPVSEAESWRITSGGVTFNPSSRVLEAGVGVTADWHQEGTGTFWLNGSDHAPYAIIQTHAGKIISRDYSPANTVIRKGFYHRFSWQTTAEIPINEPLQINYTDFQWRAKGTTAWNTERISGDRKYIDFDTGLVPNAASPGMEWQAVVYANNGTSATGGYTAVSFQSTAVRLTDLIPSSRATVYKGFAVNFSWGLSYTKPVDLSCSLRQVSAKLRWRKTGAPTYTEYAVNNATQAYILPAGVLPAGDIDWQIVVEDTSGGTNTSNWTTITCKELPVAPTDLYPADGGRVLKHQVNRFGWTVTTEGADGAPGEIIQASAVLRYRTQGQQDVKSVTLSGAQTWYDFPANTFTADDIEWQVEVTANTGTTGVSEWVHVNTQDALSLPICVFPVGVVVDDTEGVAFIWRHEISTGTSQTAYELQTSDNMGGQYTTLSTAETDTSSFATPAGQFTQGTLMWRVRTKNGDGVWGSYSAAATIIIRRAPAVPVIVYADTLPRPTIRWQSADQQGVRIQIGDYDTGWMHSTAKEFRMPYILPDGAYPVRLTIKTIFGAESSAATANITVQNMPGPSFAAGFQAIDNCIALNWQTDEAYAEYYVLRAGTAIARTKDSSYTDRFSNGRQEYVVRGVTAEGYCGDSAPVYTYLIIENAVLGLAEDGEPWLPLRLRRGERPAHEGSYSVQVDYVFYYGRTRPVAYTNGQRDASHDFSFTVRQQAQQQALRELLGRIVVYKDRWGDVVTGMLGSAQVLHDRTCDVEFTIVETDYKQEISYE